MQSTSRRNFLFLPFFGASGAAYARFVEPTWLRLSRVECRIPRLTRPVELVHLSDLHASDKVPKSLIERAVDLAASASPDVICITGDFITTSTGFDASWYAAVLRRLVDRAPTFAVLGNHDGGMWSGRSTAEVERILSRAGVRLLANDSCKINCRGAVLQMAGVGDLWAGNLDAATAFENADPECPTVLLSHNPDSKALLGAHPWDLMLSGHTHGGQVVVPVLGFSPAPVWDRNYVAGLKRWQNRWIHVSRGVGNVRGVRFNCRPEVTRIRLLCS